MLVIKPIKRYEAEQSLRSMFRTKTAKLSHHCVCEIVTFDCFLKYHLFLNLREKEAL